MKGRFYIQLTSDGEKIKKPPGEIGCISLENRKLDCFNNDDSFLLEMHVLDFMISADGILFKGIEDLNGRKLYQEVYFVPSKVQ